MNCDHNFFHLLLNFQRNGIHYSEAVLSQFVMTCRSIPTLIVLHLISIACYLCLMRFSNGKLLALKSLWLVIVTIIIVTIIGLTLTFLTTERSHIHKFPFQSSVSKCKSKLFPYSLHDYLLLDRPSCDFNIMLDNSARTAVFSALRYKAISKADSQGSMLTTRRSLQKSRRRIGY